MNGLLLILTVAGVVAIIVAIKDMCRIKNHGFIKKKHFGIKE